MNQDSICPSIGEYFLDVFLPRNLVGSRPSTVSVYRTAIHHWQRFAGHAPIVTVTPELIAGFQAASLKIHGPVSVNRSRKHLMAIFRAAFKDGILTRLPDWKWLREPKRVPLAFTIEEFKKILHQVEQLPDGKDLFSRDWWRSLLLTIWYTGARIKALLAVETIDFDEAAGGIYLRADEQKDHEDQFLDLAAEAIEAIKRIKTDHRLLFAWPYVSPRSAAKHFRRLCEAANVPVGNTTGSLFHRVRKSTASYLHLNGGDATARLGHSGPGVTKLYYDPRICTELRQARFMPKLGG